jgi:hypothetical protein
MFGPQVHSASSVTQEGAILEQTVRTLKHKTTLAMAKDPTPTNNDDSAPPRFLTVDPRAPAEIRRLLEEADGCQSMGFITGGTACARRAIDAILETEQAAGDDYAASLLTLSEKHPAVAPALFQILGMLGEGDEPLDADSLKALIVTIKAVVYEIYVLGAERIERLMYVHQLVESLKRDAGAARKGAA